MQLKIAVYSLEGKALGEVPLPGPVSGGIPATGTGKRGSCRTSPSRRQGDLELPRAERGEEALVRAEGAGREGRVRSPSGVVPVKGRDARPDVPRPQEGVAIDGDRPVLLTGYGGFNVSLTPGFSALRSSGPSSAECGPPQPAGRSEFGETWHRAGMLEKKQNVFDDSSRPPNGSSSTG